jgi:spermidine/putrescine transport system substrate-binding protein
MLRRLASSLLCIALLAVGPTVEAQRPLVVLAWPNAVPAALLERYEAASGQPATVRVHDYESGESLEDALRRRAGEIDVFLAAGRQVPRLADAGLAAELRAGELPNFGGVVPPFDAPAFDRQRLWSAPYLWGTTGFTYDRERVGATLAETWEEVFAPRAELSGRIAMLDDPVGVYEAAAYWLGIDPCTTEAAQAERIYEALAAQKPHVAVYDSDGTVARLISGEAWLHHQWNGAAHRTKARLPGAVYVVPIEGATVWSDNLMLAADSPDPEAARALIDWLLTPEAAALASNGTGYMNAVEGARAYMDARLLDDPAVALPPDRLDRLRPERVCPSSAVRLRDEVWRRIDPHAESER